MALNFRIPFLARKDAAKKAEKPVFFIDFSQKIFDLPELKDRTKIDIRYPLLPPHAFVHIFWDSADQELVYNVEEPVLSDIEKEVLRLVQLGLEEMINISYVRAAKANVIIEYLERNVKSILAELGVRVSEDTYKKVMYYIYRDSVGLNEIEPILNDYYVEDIECNGVGFYVYVVHRKYQNLRTNILYNEKIKLANFVEKLAQKAGRYISYAKPLLDGTLPDGSRVNATYTEDVTTRGPTYTIRKFTKDPWTPINIIDIKTAPPELFAYFWLAVEYKFNIMMVGETASGKTTFLNSVMSFIPPEARIVSIEDTRELNLVHENWLPAVTRSGFGMPNLVGQQYGEITLFDLLKESFRQNPDYVILGETRGKEAYVLFQGMASGHPSYSTFHAASVETLVRRLSAPPIELPASLIESLDIIGVITHVKTADENVRRLKHAQEIIQVKENNKVVSNSSFEWNPLTDRVEFRGRSIILEKIQQRLGIEMQPILEELDIRTELLKKLHENKIFGFKEVGTIINAYYKNRDGVLQKFGIPSNRGIKIAKRVVTMPTAVSFMDWGKKEGAAATITADGLKEFSIGGKPAADVTGVTSTTSAAEAQSQGGQGLVPLATQTQPQMPAQIIAGPMAGTYGTYGTPSRPVIVSVIDREVSADEKAKAIAAVEQVLGADLLKKFKEAVREEMRTTIKHPAATEPKPKLRAKKTRMIEKNKKYHPNKQRVKH